VFSVVCLAITTVKNSTFELQQRPPLETSVANYKWNILGGRLRDSVFHKVAQLFCWVSSRSHTTSQKRPFYAPHSTPRSPESAPSWLLDLVLPDCLFFFRTLNVWKCHEGIWDIGGRTPLMLHLSAGISDMGGPQTRSGRVLEFMICRDGRVSKHDSLNNYWIYFTKLIHSINYIWILKAYQRQVSAQVYLLQGEQNASF